MKNIKLWCILILIMILLPVADWFSCTIVMAAKNGMVLAGNNEDYNNWQTRVTFIPATAGRFGCVYFGYNDGWTQGGMNDQGLFCDANAVAETGWRADPAKLNLSVDWKLHILQTCATVADVRTFFEAYNMPGLKKARFPFADRSGAAMVVEYAGGKVHFIMEKTWYQVSTNFLRTDYPGAKVPCDRFRLAQQMLDPADELSVPLIRSILSATHQEGKYSTVYSNIYDLKAGLIYVYRKYNFKVVAVLNLDDELKKGTRTIRLSKLFSMPPSVSTQAPLLPDK